MNGAVLPVGAHPGNTGGKKGRSGRKPDEFKAMMQRLVSSEDRIKQLRKVLNNANHPHFLAAYKMAAEFGYGKATQSMEHSGKDGAPIDVQVSVVDLRNKIAGRIAGLGARITATADLAGAVSSRTTGDST